MKDEKEQADKSRQSSWARLYNLGWMLVQGGVALGLPVYYAPTCLFAGREAILAAAGLLAAAGFGLFIFTLAKSHTAGPTALIGAIWALSAAGLLGAISDPLQIITPSPKIRSFFLVALCVWLMAGWYYVDKASPSLDEVKS